MVSCSQDIVHFPLEFDPKHKMIIIVSLLLLLPFASPLSFNFSSFTPDDHDIIYDQSGHQANNSIQLVRDQRPGASVGRATYNQSLHLWDRASGNIADFTTNFSFVINSSGGSPYADGFAFFLAQSSRLLNNAAGGMMGLTDVALAWNSTSNPFVAVEFDIHNNIWDPSIDDHVGIDINSMSSVANITWSTDASILEGRQHEAWISYDSKSRNLSVLFTGYRNRTSFIQRLSSTVDFREHLPEFVSFGFSAATGDYFASHTINSWSFSSTLDVATTGTPNHWISPPGSNSAKSDTKLVIWVVVGGTVSVLVSGLLIFFWWKRKNGLMNEGGNFDVEIGNDFERGSGAKNFAYKDLKKATNNFAHQGKLGEGGFGSVYKGFLKAIDSHVAVKRISKGSKQGIKEYASEVMIISRLRHRNLVQLLGWCHEKKELLLVYEFMPNGSLDSHLFNGESFLDWSIRLKIAQGLASALLYLHEEWEQYVVHRDIKSSNIMLDSSFNAKLGDFGLARMVDHEKGCQTTALAGTWGYMAPEYVITRKATKEIDVFSFGIVVLEIASGRKVTNPLLEEGEYSLVEWIWSLHGNGNLLDAADPQLGSDFDSGEMEQMLIVGLWCAHPFRTLRPSIKQAVLALSNDAPLPVLPPRMIVQPSCPPSVNEISSTSDITIVSAR